MRLRLGPNAAAAGAMAGMALAALITMLNGLAFIALCFAVMMLVIFMFDPPALTGAGVFLVVWIVAAWLVSCSNIVIGLQALDQPTGRRLAWLYGSSVGVVLLYPGTLFMLFG